VQASRDFPESGRRRENSIAIRRRIEIGRLSDC
jgi:hypothetical protein